MIIKANKKRGKVNIQRQEGEMEGRHDIERARDGIGEERRREGRKEGRKEGNRVEATEVRVKRKRKRKTL